MEIHLSIQPLLSSFMLYLHRSFSGYHCSAKSLPSAICGSFGICSCIHYWAYQFSILCRKYSDGKLATALRSTFTMKAGLGILYSFSDMLTITELLFKPWFPGFIGIGYEWVWYLVFFLFGYICIISREQYYEFLNTNRKLITACNNVAHHCVCCDTSSTT